MLKIYNAYANNGTINIDDYIRFENGRYESGAFGYGNVYSGNLNCIKANYDNESLNSFKNYIKGLKNVDGFVENFVLLNPLSYEMFKEKLQMVNKTTSVFKQYGLSDEAVILFTQGVCIKYPKDNSIIRLLGRYPDVSMNIVMPGTNFDMSFGVWGFNEDIKENFEVLQSKSLSKELVLTKMKRTF